MGKTPSISLQRLPPERMARFPNLGSTAIGAGSCCCCCCCGHSLGGVIGAAAVSGRSAPSTSPATQVFWLAFLAYSMGGLIICGIAEGMGVGLLILLLVLPGVQLVAAATAIIILSLLKIENRAAACARVGSLVLGTLAGSLIGGLLTVAVLFGLK